MEKTTLEKTEWKELKITLHGKTLKYTIPHEIVKHLNLEPGQKPKSKYNTSTQKLTIQF